MLVSFFLGQSVLAKPTTRFVVPYLTLVGLLAEEGQAIDTAHAFAAMKRRVVTAQPGSEEAAYRHWYFLGAGGASQP